MSEVQDLRHEVHHAAHKLCGLVSGKAGLSKEEQIERATKAIEVIAAAKVSADKLLTLVSERDFDAHMAQKKANFAAATVAATAAEDQAMAAAAAFLNSLQMPSVDLDTDGGEAEAAAPDTQEEAPAEGSEPAAEQDGTLKF